MSAEELRKPADKVFHVRVVVWTGLRHLDHVQEVAGHGIAFRRSHRTPGSFMAATKLQKDNRYDRRIASAMFVR